MKTTRYFLVIAIALALSGLFSSRALAKEIVGISISGPGLPGEIDISDPQALKAASAPWYDFQPVIKPANLPQASYYEIHMAIGAEQEIVATNVYHYFPGASGRPGYFYYAECVGCSSTSIGAWYRISDQEDLALRKILVDLGAPERLLGSAEKTTARPAGSVQRNSFGLPSSVLPAALVGLALLALVGLGILSRRRFKPTLQE